MTKSIITHLPCVSPVSLQAVKEFKEFVKSNLSFHNGKFIAWSSNKHFYICSKRKNVIEYAESHLRTPRDFFLITKITSTVKHNAIDLKLDEDTIINTWTELNQKEKVKSTNLTRSNSKTFQLWNEDRNFINRVFQCNVLAKAIIMKNVIKSDLSKAELHQQLTTRLYKKQGIQLPHVDAALNIYSLLESHAPQLTQDIFLFKGMKGTIPSEPYSEVQSNEILSMTVSLEHAKSISPSYILVLKVPQNTRILSLHKLGTDKEVLLQTGTRYIIDKIFINHSPPICVGHIKM